MNLFHLLYEVILLLNVVLQRLNLSLQLGDVQTFPIAQTSLLGDHLVLEGLLLTQQSVNMRFVARDEGLTLALLLLDELILGCLQQRYLS